MNINVSLNLISTCTLSFIVFRESEEFKFQMNRIYKRLSITISGEKLKIKKSGQYPKLSKNPGVKRFIFIEQVLIQANNRKV